MTRNPDLESRQPFPIGRQFLVVSADSGTTEGTRTPLILGPGRAFGSGRHETTISCIEEVEKLGSLAGKTVLDVGAGTGILTVAAALLDANRVIAVDIETDAASTCRNNAILNGVEDRVRTVCGTLDSITAGRSYHLILANIHGDIIMRAADTLAARLRPEGYLILSGIDYTDSTPIKFLFQNKGLEEHSTTFHREYVTQVWFNPPGLSPEPPADA